MKTDADTLMKGVAIVIKEQMDAALAPVLDRLNAVEQRLDQLPVPKDGKDADMAALGETIKQEVTAATSTIPARIRDAVTEAVAALPNPTGPVPDEKAIAEKVSVELIPWLDGLVRDAETILHRDLSAEIVRQCTGLPVPKDGKDADPAPIQAAVMQHVTTQLEAIADASTKQLNEATSQLSEMVAAEVAKIPIPQNGKDADQESIIAAVVGQLGSVMEQRFVELSTAILRQVPEDIATLVAQETAKIPVPKDADEQAITRTVLAQVMPQVDAIIGRNIELSDAVADAITKLPDLAAGEVAKIPVPKDGKDADPEVIRVAVNDAVGTFGRQAVADLLVKMDELVNEAVVKIPVPKDGKDANPEAITLDVVEKLRPVIEEQMAGLEISDEKLRNLVDGAVETAVKGLTFPEPPTIGDIAPLVEKAVSDAVTALAKTLPEPKDGKDGAAIVDALVNREGELVLTLSDGRTKNVGKVVGQDADHAGLEALVRKLVDEIPKPRDGFGFEDLDMTYDGERGLTIIFERGEHRKEFKYTLPIPIYRGVWKEGSYLRGDTVTYAGSSWIAQKDDVQSKPDAGEGDWQLSTKRGRDGKDAPQPERKPVTNLKVGTPEKKDG